MREHDIRHFSFERPTASVPWEGNERPTLNAAFSWRKTGRGEKPSARGEAGRRRGQTAVFRRSSRDLRDGGQQREPGSCPAALWLPLLALSLRTGTGLPSLGPRAGHAEGVSESPDADGRAPWEGPGCSQNGEPQLPRLAVFLNWGGTRGSTWPELLTAQQRCWECQVDVGGHFRVALVTPERRTASRRPSAPLR